MGAKLRPWDGGDAETVGWGRCVWSHVGTKGRTSARYFPTLSVSSLVDVVLDALIHPVPRHAQGRGGIAVAYFLKRGNSSFFGEDPRPKRSTVRVSSKQRQGSQHRSRLCSTRCGRNRDSRHRRYPGILASAGCGVRWLWRSLVVALAGRGAPLACNDERTGRCDQHVDVRDSCGGARQVTLFGSIVMIGYEAVA